MIQKLMYDRFGVFSNVFSIAQVLKNLGLSWQKAAGISAHLDAEKRQAWRTTTGPQLLRRAQERKALLLCGDAASLPPWGTLTYPWARRGQHPTVQTSGKRQGSTVCGLLASCQGRFFYHGQEGRRHAAAYLAFLTRVLEQTSQPMIRMQDGATEHTSAETTAFFAQPTARLEVCQLPTYAPDYHPLEKLWKKSKQQETH
jgi:DDE superfamily endonuclease/Winged helix-turn helix